MSSIPKLLSVLIVGVIFSLQTLYSSNTTSFSFKEDSSLTVNNKIDYLLNLSRETYITNVEKSLEYAQIALAKAIEDDSKWWIAECKLTIGRYFENLGSSKDALEQFQDALLLFESLDDQLNKMKAIKEIGDIYWYSGEYKLALDYSLDVIQFARTNMDTTLWINGMITQGAVYGNISKMDSALYLFNEAYDLARIIRDDKLQVSCLFNIGDVYLYTNKPKKAIETFKTLESNYDLSKVDPKYLSIMYNSMSLAYLALKDVKMAKLYSQKVWNRLQVHPRLNELRKYYLYQFQIDTLEKDYESAIKNYIKSEALNDSLSNSNFKTQLANFETVYKLKNKEIYIKELTTVNKLKDLEIKQKTFVNYASALFIILLLTLIVFVIRAIKIIRDRNRVLQEQKEELEVTQLHLVQSEKMASLGTLSSGLAHEINNPLNFITGGIHLIKELKAEVEKEISTDSFARLNIATEMVSNGLDRVAGIVKTLNSFSPTKNSERIDTNVHEIIDNTLLFLNSKIDDDIVILKDYQLKSLVPVYSDKLHQVIINILNNAIFAVGKNENNERKISILTEEINTCARIKINNTGPKILSTHLKQLFDPFFTTKDPGKGVGLGLSISYTLIQEHNGEIYAENMDDGVSFMIELPL